MHPSVPVAFLAGSVGPGELIVWFAVILLLFGPRRLPEIARQLGKALAHLRRASQEFQSQVMQIAEEPHAGTADEDRKPDTAAPLPFHDGTQPPMAHLAGNGSVPRAPATTGNDTFASQPMTEQPAPAPEAGDSSDLKPEETGKHDLAG